MLKRSVELGNEAEPSVTTPFHRSLTNEAKLALPCPLEICCMPTLHVSVSKSSFALKRYSHMRPALRKRWLSSNLVHFMKSLFRLYMVLYSRIGSFAFISEDIPKHVLEIQGCR
ncbi:hypothetical protein F2P81_015675 [Scophthalmus maximus]|uniref:Uncharacterized protein n=1 Tax=Scophthalmus maximus TaxID=52904 RepID=A0A6A4SGV6_SCOMX|nr:hypothetical protein F2P81_015675 [Scophthalmus maximus]